jgi:hypothetical protein
MIVYNLKTLDALVAGETKPQPAARRMVRNALRLPAVQSALMGYHTGKLDFDGLKKKLQGYVSINAALISLAEEPEKQVLQWMRLVLNLRPGPRSAPRYLEAFWQMARQTAWKEKDINDIYAYFAKAMRRQERRLRSQESVPESDSAIVADDTLPDPNQIEIGRDLLEEIRHLSTPTQRLIVDLLYQGNSREDVSRILRITSANIRTQLSALRKKI